MIFLAHEFFISLLPVTILSLKPLLLKEQIFHSDLISLYLPGRGSWVVCVVLRPQSIGFSWCQRSARGQVIVEGCWHWNAATCRCREMNNVQVNCAVIAKGHCQSHRWWSSVIWLESPSLPGAEELTGSAVNYWCFLSLTFFIDWLTL